MRLVLASASPRRAELLTAAGFTFEAQVVDVDESVRPNESPSEYVVRLAAEKSANALERLLANVGSGFSRIDGPHDAGPPEGGAHDRGPHDREPQINVADTSRDFVVLGADTAVVVDNDILGKPRNDEDARAMLRRLSGRAHQVMTGISLRAHHVERGTVETTTVWFAPISSEDIEWYVESGEGRDKAGAYAIQGLASRFIPRIEGSYSNVVGLPVARVFELLSELTAISSTRPNPSAASSTDSE
jgi:septum formation protein